MTPPKPQEQEQKDWVLVPREPTEGMLDVMVERRCSEREIYADILAAAPSPPSDHSDERAEFEAWWLGYCLRADISIQMKPLAWAVWEACASRAARTTDAGAREAETHSDMLRSLTAAVEIGRAMAWNEAADMIAASRAWDGASHDRLVALGMAMRAKASSVQDVEALTETVARAIGNNVHDEGGFDMAGEINQRIYRSDARAVLRSLGIGGKE